QRRQRHLRGCAESDLAEPGFGEVDEEGSGRTVVGVAEAVAEVGRGRDPAWGLLGRGDVVVESVATGYCHACDVWVAGAGGVDGEFGHAEVVVGDLVRRLQGGADVELGGGLPLRPEESRPVRVDLRVRVVP